MIRVKGYNHVGIVIKNLKKCMGFYGEVLGLKSIPRPQFKFSGHWYQVGPEAQLHLMVLEESIPGTMRHIALEVEDFDETVEDLKSRGIKIVDGPGKRQDESDYLFCHDPDGNLVEITRHP